MAKASADSKFKDELATIEQCKDINERLQLNQN